MRRFIPVLLSGACLLFPAAFWLGGIPLSTISQPRGAIAFTDRYGAPLGTVTSADARHTMQVRLRDVSPSFLQAILAAEDARFFFHGAVDWLSVLRAAREDIFFGQPRSGASTITMQVARSIDHAPSTLRGKLAETFDAYRIEAKNSKRSILRAYINAVPMGGNIYGVQAAAHTYFGTPAKDLDLAHAAYLAAIPNDPVRLDPYGDHATAIRARMRYVLERMQADGMIDALDARRALAETLTLQPLAQRDLDAAHLLFALYRSAAPQTTRIRTTLDRSLQRFVQAQVVDVLGALRKRNVQDAAVLVVENRTGAVRAYVGSPGYFDDAVLGANDGVRALRQPGSALKPFAYELALERHAITTTTILDDTQSTYALANGQTYQPQDYSRLFSGPVSVRYALANSLNVPAVHVLARVGVDAFLTRLHALGFRHLTHTARTYGLGLVLGAGEVQLWELARAYATIERDGDIPHLHAIAGQRGTLRKHVGSVAMWRIITSMLADPIARSASFGRKSVLEMPYPAAVKTGTSSGYRDTWTVGFTRDYTVAVWAGNFDGSAMQRVSGVSGAGPLWNRIMLHLYEGHPDPPHFPTPPGYALRSNDGTLEWMTPNQRIAHAPHGISITWPHDGARFALFAATSARQAIQLRATGYATPPQWSIDGKAVASQANGALEWQLKPGIHRITARDAHSSAAIRITVIPSSLAPPRTGFTLHPRAHGT